MHQLNDTPTRAMTALRSTIKDQKVGGGPIPGVLCSLSKTAGIILPLPSLMKLPINTNHTMFQGLPPPERATFCPSSVCLPGPRSLSQTIPRPEATLTFWARLHSVYGMCLSLCLSPNSFCNGTSRTWASVRPETRHGVWSQRKVSGFKPQSELYGFTLTGLLWRLNE